MAKKLKSKGIAGSRNMLLLQLKPIAGSEMNACSSLERLRVPARGVPIVEGKCRPLQSTFSRE